MFNKSNGSVNNGSKTTNGTTPSFNMISEGTVIKGALETESDIRVSGVVEGELSSKGKCIISETGAVKGNINASEADIAGTIEGEVVISDRLILRQSAVIKGDISTNVLLVEEGASFDGICKMSTTLSVKESENKKIKKPVVDKQEVTV